MTTNTKKTIENMTINSIGKGNFSIVTPYSQNHMVKAISAMQRLWDLVNLNPYSGNVRDMILWTEQPEIIERATILAKFAILHWAKSCAAEFGMMTFIPEFKDKATTSLTDDILEWYQVIEEVVNKFNSKRNAI